MNLARLGFSAWIIILNIVLLTTLLIVVTSNRRDYFVNYPQQVNPTAPIKSNPEANTANNNYASILMYIQRIPLVLLSLYQILSKNSLMTVVL